jgi:hypothetical protein
MTGWKGLIACADSNIGFIRFTNEGIQIPLGVTVDNSVHTGLRTSSVFQFGIVVPSGTISMPLLSDDMTTSVETSVALGAKDKLILTRAIQPYDAAPDTYPILDTNNITIYRGDSAKILYEPWIESITVSSSAGQKIDVSLSLKSIYGEYSDINGFPEKPTFGKARAIMFNELDWTGLFNSISKFVSFDTESSYPKRFSITINNGIMNDETPNTSLAARIQKIRAIRGFALGYQSVTCSIDFAGQALNSAGDQVKQYSLPFGEVVDVGGLYTISDGIITERSLPVPSNEEIAISTLTITGMLAGNSPNDYPVNPGSLLL